MEGLEAQVADLTAKLNEAEAPRKRLEKENSVRTATALPQPHRIFALLLLSVLPIFHSSKELTRPQNVLQFKRVFLPSKEKSKWCPFNLVFLICDNF